MGNGMFLASSIESSELMKIAQPFLDVCNAVVPVVLAVVGALGVIWAIILGVKLAKAVDPQEHEKAKQGLKNFIIGFVLIFVLLVAVQVSMVVFTDWYTHYPIPQPKS